MKSEIRIRAFRFQLALMLFINIMFLFSTVILGQCDNSDFEKKLSSSIIYELANTSDKKRQETIITIYCLEKEAIPVLIEHIDDIKGVPFLLINPRNSTLTGPQLENSIGLTSVYLIELILGRENFSINKEENAPFTFGNSANYVYWQGIIVDSNNKVVKGSDLYQVKIQYEDWWSKNKDKSIENLRKDWAEGKKPLSQSEYKWK